MVDAHSAHRADLTPDPRHLELIEQEVARHQQNALRIRLAALACVGGYIALHAQQGPARYMFFAPVIALGAWLLDAQTEWHIRALRALEGALRGATGARVAPLSLDTSPWHGEVSWRSAVLRPARVAFFHPLATIAAYIAVDAPRLDPEGVPSELLWYLAITFVAFITLVLVAGSWWYDHFGTSRTQVAAPLPPSRDRVMPQGFLPFPVSHAASALPPPAAPPSVVTPAPVEGPFPVAQRTEATKPFGTAVGETPNS